MTQTIQILAFGIAKDILGGRFVSLELPGGCTLGQLRVALSERYPALAGLASLRIAINSEYADNEAALLHEGDEVALIPPVAGG